MIKIQTWFIKIGEMLLVSVSALESNTASKDTINDSASVVVFCSACARI